MNIALVTGSAHLSDELGEPAQNRIIGRARQQYDAWHPIYNQKAPVLGCLDFLVSEGFFDPGDIEEALAVTADGLAVPERLARIAEVLTKLKAAR